MERRKLKRRDLYLAGLSVAIFIGILIFLQLFSDPKHKYIDMLLLALGIPIIVLINSIMIKRILVRSFNISDLIINLHTENKGMGLLNNARGKLTDLIDRMNDGVGIQNEDGIITYVNDIVARMLGYEKSEIIGRNVFELLDEENRAIFSSQLKKRREIGFENYEIVWQAKDGRKISTIVSPLPLIDSRGVFRGSLAIITDITGRKEYEQILKLSEEKFRSIVKYLSDIILIIDDNTRIKFESDSVSRILGYEPGYFIGRIGLDYVHPEDKENVINEMHKLVLKANAHIPTEFRFRHADGHWVYLEAIGDNQSNTQGIEGLVITARDTTARKQYERELAETATIINKSPVVAFLWGSGEGWPVEFVSRNVLELTGYSVEEFLKGEVIYRDIIHSDDLDRVTAEVNKYSADQSRTRFSHKPYRIISKDGKARWVEDTTEISRNKDGRINYFYGIVTDITERINAEENLRESENRYKSLIETSPVPMVVHSDDRIVYANSSAIKTLDGNSENRFIGKSIFNFIHPDCRDRVRQGVDRIQAKNAGPELLEAKFITLEGREIEVEIEGLMIDYCGTAATLTLFQDISMRKKAERALTESEEKYRNVVERANDGIVIVQDGRLEYCNPAAERMLGYIFEEMVGTPIELYIHPDEIKKVMEIYRKRMAGLWAPSYYETILKHRDGYDIEVELNSGIIQFKEKPAILVFIRDITQSKLADKALRESEEKFRNLAQRSPNMIFINVKGRIEYVNDKCVEVLGFTKEEFYSPDFDFIKLIAPEDKDLVMANFARHIKGEEIDPYEYTLICKNGERIQAINATKLMRFGGETAILGIVTDITETKKLQEFVSRAQRLETAGRIAGQVAHDFNNLLAPLMAYPDFIRAELEEGHPAIQYINDIETAAEQMADINQQLLTLGRRGHYNLEPLNLNDIIKQVVRQIQPLPDSLILDLELSDDLMLVKGGRSQILRAILNLINNARDSMLDAGCLKIQTQNYYSDDKIGKFGRVARGEYARLTVSDTGAGIPIENMSKILEPFFTTKTAANKRGSGLGLSIVHAVMEDHKGYIDIETEAGLGTSFHLFFPITRESVEMAEEEEVSGGNEKILVVDDDQIQRSVSLKLLQKLGYRASAVESGEKALEFIKDNPQDLIILDMIMPGGMDGFDTYMRILKIYPNQKSLVVSGYAESENINHLIRHGAGAYLRKPLTLKSIGLAVRKELDKAEKKDAIPDCLVR